ncbi:MAG: MFS transporter [Marinilabiliaceae bacterium]|jgi:GPH family glycoside/pentoside/hexuronide:cation symporter|nr:MFS transporter [Marinilabiliaceae bacterium]
MTEVRSSHEQEKPVPVDRQHPVRTTLAYGLGPLTDQMSHQMFQFLVFTYYYAVAGIDINTLAWSFIIFAVWDSINDPVIGQLSDNTRNKRGRRRWWILISAIPFGIANALLFTVGTAWSPQLKAAYMIMIIILYDTVYTMFSTNQLALFSEMFRSDEERGFANMWKSIFIIVGVIIGFVLPTIFIDNLVPIEGLSDAELAKIPNDYIVTGVIIGFLTIIGGLLFYKYGMKEPEMVDHFAGDKKEKEPGMIKMLKETLSNGAFIIFCIANLVKWTTFKMLTTIIALYAVWVLGVQEGNILISVLLLAAFISAGALFPVMKKIGIRLGWRNAFILSQLVWCAVLVPFWFLDGRPYLAIVFMAALGFGLSGAIFYIEPIIAQIIDEDEVKTGKRRAGSYYGINGLINRYSTILVFALLALILKQYGWEQYLVGKGMEASPAEIDNLVTALKVLMVPINIAANLIVVAFLLWFPLHGKRLAEVQRKLKELQASRSV